MTTKRSNSIDFIEFPARSSAELAAAKAFFNSVLGWWYRDWGEHYSDTQDSAVGSGMNAHSKHRPTQPLVVVYSADLELAQSKVLKAGGIVTKDILAFPGGRRFHFKDPAGNVLAVWSNNSNQDQS
jgi:predicted enzyme related to lactoylglutathione lyase